MAKPINPYQGPAPAAMAQMGQGLMEAGANAARITQAGYESMGKSIAGGVNAITESYKQYKDTESEVKASEKSYNTLKSFLPKEVSKKFDEEIESLNKSDTTSLRDKAAFWNQAKSFIGGSVGRAFEMQKQQAELNAAAARQAATLEEQRMEPFRKKSAELLYNPMTSGGALGPQNFGIQPQQNRPTGVFGGLL